MMNIYEKSENKKGKNKKKVLNGLKNTKFQ